jgi:hypothetical protein
MSQREAIGNGRSDDLCVITFEVSAKGVESMLESDLSIRYPDGVTWRLPVDDKDTKPGNISTRRTGR